jgi:RNA-directed DNA polymerase
MHWDKRYGYGPRVENPKAKAVDLRRKVKARTGTNTTLDSLDHKLQEINLIVRGWTNYYRYCARASRVFTSLDWYITGRIWRWLRKKRPKARARELLLDLRPSARRATRKLWRHGSTEQYLLAWMPVGRFRLAWMRTPNFAVSSGEPDA